MYDKKKTEFQKKANPENLSVAAQCDASFINI